jgi:hypothetical protein
MGITLASRLHAVIAVVCPIDGVAILDPILHTARIDFSSSATNPQKTAANSALATFDWSDPAQVTFDAAAANTAASASIDRGATNIGLPVDKLTVGLALTILDEINVIRSALALAPRTQLQLLNAVKTKIAALPT